MACNVTIEDDVINITADNGQPSILFQEAKDLTGNQQLASDIWGVGNSEVYKEEFTEPQIAEYQTTLYKKLNLLQPAQESIEIVVKDKPQIVYLDSLEIEKVTANNFTTYLAKAGDVVLGRLRTKNFQGNTQVEAVTLSAVQVYNQGELEGLQGKGIGTELYKEAVFDNISQNKSFYSDSSRTQSSESLWNKFLNIGLAQREGNLYKISPYPSNIDQNREPNVNDVVHYIDQQNVKEPLSDLEIIQLRTDLLNIDTANSDELKEILNTAFFPSPTREKLLKAGIYTSIEIENILRNTELQNNIKEFTLKLNNTEQTVEKFSDADTRFLTGIGTNSFGKTQITNPYINEQDAVNKLGGTEESMFDEELQNSDLDYLKTQSDLFPFFNQFKRIQQKVFTGTELINKPQTDTLELFEQVLQEDENGAVRGRISRLLNVHPFAWETSSEEVKTLLRGLDRDALKIGLDLKNLEEFYEDRSVDEIKDFLTVTSEMLTTGNIESFVPVYDQFFGVDTSPKTVVEKLTADDKIKSLYKVVTNQPAYELFRTTGLLPIGNDNYQRTDALRKDLPALYEILEARTFLTAEDIQKDIKNIDLSNVTLVDTNVLEKMAIYARLFNGKLDNIKDITSPVEDQYIKFQPVSETFVADFYAKQLSEQRKDSEDYQSFYSNFQVGENGINLISADPITVAKVSSQMALFPGLTTYFNAKLESDLRFPQEIYEELDDSYLRQYYANYPKALDIYQDNYQQISSAEIEAQSKEPFIRTSQGVYELTGMMGKNSLYTKLNQNENTQYKNYDLNEIPDSNIIPASINEIDSEIKVVNLYNKSQEEEINNKLACK